ncbi:MAG: alanine--tRNA ligase [Candidatus Aminicenantes bacterium RBG_16_63_16]|nr:MAG: alanine--tRNA ligase [Candidatus Aminicenantes bacterium RBG_16_63_16]
MDAQDIRDAFLGFFSRRGHKVVPSASLLPKDDPTILFTNAGMNQFKNIFLGLERRSYKRAATVQKCLRVSGKHNDLEQVGRTSKHHTFFEMLGNFSFGDYFKREAIGFAWELVTDVFRLPPDRLYATIYEEDDEAFRIWNEDIGVPAARIFRYGKKDNFWAMGDTGPCGPCSEIHYDSVPGLEEGDPYALIEKGSDRFVELWNLVFMQYFQDETGRLNPLPSPSIDTGMGLERTAAALQRKKSNFDTDLFRPLIDRISDLARREYPEAEPGDTSVRIIADHVRAVTFLIGDGIMPANDGRGYVLRRLIRRAFRHGNALGIEKPFLHQLVGVIADNMKSAYPELLGSIDYISRLCLSEEERFASTLSSGLRYFQEFVEDARQSGRPVLAGPELFKLYDTFGFPLDLSMELAREHGLEVDEPGFQGELEKQKERARSSWKGESQLVEKKVFEGFKKFRVVYKGYETDRVEGAEVLAIIRDREPVPALGAGERGLVILDVTPFYAEAGGQVGDSGRIWSARFSGLARSAFYPVPELIVHDVEATLGELRVGDRVEAAVDPARRRAVAGNHTATHLLHAALRQTLGDHVKQSGSLVSADRLRFDFTHFTPLAREELRGIEGLVNEKVRANLRVDTRVLALEEGLREGATAIFEEKYGEKVRMVVVGDFSKELCGGVHVRATGEIGLFKIVSESGIAAGMRRVEAVTGEAALRYAQEMDDLLADIQGLLASPRKELPQHIDKLKSQLAEAEKEIRGLRQKLAGLESQSGPERIRAVKGVSVLVQRLEGLTMEELRNLADSLKQKMGSGVVVLGSVGYDGKALIVASVTGDLAQRLRADALIREIAPLIGGGGGGRADFAQAGGKLADRLDQALEKSYSVVEKLA